VFDRVESFHRPPADALRGRVGRDQIGVRRFQRPEVAEERVEFRVADLGPIVNVVLLFVVANQITEFANALGGKHAGDGLSWPDVGSFGRITDL
jgi:hypothetical protein